MPSKQYPQSYSGVELFSNSKSQKSKLLNFPLAPQRGPKISETLMSNFVDLQISTYQKRLFKRRYRHEIAAYKLTPTDEIIRQSLKLVKEINKRKADLIHIKSYQFGTFICLAAILSGKINDSKYVDFELDLAPIKLFPKELCETQKKPCEKISIQFQASQDNWLIEFEDLTYQEEILTILNKNTQKQAA